MATIKVRIPSKKIGFGFLEFEGDAAELGFDINDPHACAQRYVDLMIAYTRSEIGSVEAASKQAAAATTKEQLREELGARAIEETLPTKPWEKETKAQTSKPWENKAAAAISSDWDI